MKKPLLCLLSLLAASFAIISFLVFTATVPNKEKNGFNRRYLNVHVTPMAVRPAGSGMAGIAGATATHFFFSTSDPEKLSSTDHFLQHDSLLSFSLSKGIKDSMNIYFYAQVDSPLVYIFAGNIPAILSTDMQQHTIQTTWLPKGGFSQGLAFGKNSFMLRKLDLDVPDQFFMRLDSEQLAREQQLSEGYKDAGMSTDGNLLYDPSTNQFTYLYHYRNTWLTFNKQLHLISSGHTIDTFSHFRFELSKATAEKEKVFTSAGPEKIVNTTACVYKGQLFVHSTLKADNDDAAAFHERTIIDVYQLQQGAYAGSFYLPVPGNEHIRKMMIVNNVLLVLGRDKVYTFNIY